MAASSPQAESPLLLPHHIPAPPGWQRKVCQRKGQSLLKKIDVVYIAPDGEEIKSKAHLQRYLKAHPDGPIFSEFNWSTGETPTRRSERLGIRGAENVETDITPKKTKRNSIEFSQELTVEDQSVSTPSPHGKRSCNAISKDKIDAPVNVLLSSTVQEEMMEETKDVEGGKINTEGKDARDIDEEKSITVEKVHDVIITEKVEDVVITEKVQDVVITENMCDVTVRVDQTGSKVDEAYLQPTTEPDFASYINEPNITEEVPAQPADALTEDTYPAPDVLNIEAEYREPVEPMFTSVDAFYDAMDNPEIEEPFEQEKENGISKIFDSANKEFEQQAAYEAPDYCSSRDATKANDKDTSQGDLHHCSEPVGVNN